MEFGKRSKTVAELKALAPRDALNMKRVANNTLYYELPEGSQCWQLHGTRIVEYWEGQIMLNSGGYKTQTTKSRMNDYIPAGWYIYQEKGKWFISTGEGEHATFYDGIVLNLNGTIPVITLDNAARYESQDDKVLKQIKAYCDKVQELIDNDALPQPDGGDCWLCRMPDPTCIQSHLEELYVHGTLIVNAYRAAGYRDDQLPYIWGNWNTKHIVRRYLKKCMGLAA